MWIHTCTICSFDKSLCPTNIIILINSILWDSHQKGMWGEFAIPCTALLSSNDIFFDEVLLEQIISQFV